MSSRQILVTGAEGFIGRNLCVRLRELGYSVLPITRSSNDLCEQMANADAIIHLAGSNRPADPAEFMAVNRDFAATLGLALMSAGRRVPLILASTQKALDDTAYGRSKLAGEQALIDSASRNGSSVHIFRLPNVFGKWSRPHYNSVVATFCYNIARGLPIELHDPAARLRLIYIDDLVEAFVSLLEGPASEGGFETIEPVYDTTVGDVAEIIQGFRKDRQDNLIAEVGTGLIRALYATYVSFLPTGEFAYPIASHRDPRGAFSEMLKTRSAGQFSYFTAMPGITRGGHYHHTKTEKFLVVHGRARFRFRHVLTSENHELVTSSDSPIVVETIPGWSHDITNIGDEVMVCLLWANELFDRNKPDTVAAAV